MYYLFIQTLLQLKISDQTYSLGAFLGKDPDEVKQNKQEKLEHQVSEVNFSHPSDKHFPFLNKEISGLFSAESQIFTKTCPCNKQRFFSDEKNENFFGKVLIFLIFLLKTLIVSTS